MPLLDSVFSPADLRKLSLSQLRQVSDEIREDILMTISAVGGHLSSNLGSVELAVALHYAFETPEDRIVWDVGHQTYAHKILTGRRRQLRTIRRYKGISGFPARAESEYDAFGTAHASTSISAALGMAAAARRQGDERRVVAVIGDGALSGGMAFEAMNNAGVRQDLNLLVVLNDNEMSISPAVGAVTKYLSRVLASRFYNRMQQGGRRMLSGVPVMQRFARRAHEHLKGMVLPGTMFEEFGFNYAGPIDGHDVERLAKTLQGLRGLPGPRFLHVVTVKGKGFGKAEADPVLYHGVGAFEPARGIAPMKVEAEGGDKKPNYSDVFGEWMMFAAQRDERVVAITPAMREGSGLVRFAEAFPERYFDVGIAEQHAVTFAAGLACGGQKPVLAIYSTFLQRAYDQVIHDVAIQNLPVVFAVDRGGLVGADGATHHGVFDLSFLRAVPNMTIMTPADEGGCWRMLNTALSMESPAVVRYPRGQVPGGAPPRTEEKVPIGRGEVVRQGGGRVALLVFGAPLGEAVRAAEALDATVADMRFVKPLDGALVLELARVCSLLVTVEENVTAGGGGSAVAECLHAAGAGGGGRVLHLGVPDVFVAHGAPAELLAECGLDAAGIERQVREVLEAMAEAEEARNFALDGEGGGKKGGGAKDKKKGRGRKVARR